MSNCYVFPEEELTALANAVRTKTGNSDKMTINGMTQAISNISSSSVAVYGITNAYDFGELTESGNFTQNCNLFPKYIGHNITSLSNNAFRNSSIEEFEFPSLVSIGSNAFIFCLKLIDVNIPNSVTSLGNSAFSACYNLTHVNLSSNLTVINSSVFMSCNKLDNVVIPNPITKIGPSMFRYCRNLKNILIANSVTYIGDYAFANCDNLGEINIPNSVTDMIGYTFMDCYNLDNVVIPDSVVNIGSSIFVNCYNLRNITLSNSITRLKFNMFMNCYNLRNVTISNSVTNIEANAFWNCNNLLNITIPNSVLNIDSNAFYRCSNMNHVIFRGTPTFIRNTSFNNCISLNDIYVPWAEGAVSGAPWGATNATVHYNTIYDQNITGITVNNGEIMNVLGTTYQVKYAYTPDEWLIDPAQLGVTFSLGSGSQYASIDQNGLLTLTSTPSDGDTIEVIAASTYNSMIQNTGIITARYIPQTVNINTFNGQWIDTNTTIDNANVFKSDYNSYHINGGLSRMRVTISGYDSFTVMLRSYAEGSYDYAELGALDATNIARGSGILSTSGKQSSTDYYGYTFENLGYSEHSFEVIYSKDSSDNSNDDRGYVYFPDATNIIVQ